MWFMKFVRGHNGEHSSWQRPNGKALQRKYFLSKRTSFSTLFYLYRRLLTCFAQKTSSQTFKTSSQTFKTSCWSFQGSAQLVSAVPYWRFYGVACRNDAPYSRSSDIYTSLFKNCPFHRELSVFPGKNAEILDETAVFWSFAPLRDS